MRIHTLAITAVLALAPLPPASPSVLRGAPGRAGDLRELLAAQAASVAELSAEDIWRRIGAIEDAARDLSGESLAAEVDRLLQAGTQPSEAAALLLCGLRLSAPDPEAAKLLRVLVPMVDSSREDLAAAAAGLLEHPHFKALNDEGKKELRSALGRVASDASRAPAVRLAAAQALFTQGGGDERRQARHEMMAFLDSADSELRALGALALARTNAEISGALYDELHRLEALPGERGRLAASYLERERVREEWNRKLKSARTLYEERLQAEQGQATPGTQPEGIEQVATALEMIRRWHLEGDKVEDSGLLDAAMDGMLRSLDEHSSYLSPKAYARFEQELEAGYGGIGAYVVEDPDDGLFTITHPIYSGPAYKAGLLSEDKIVRIDDWPTVGKPVDEIIKRLKGRPGTQVKLYVWRRGMDPALVNRPGEEMAVEVARDSITIPSVQYQVLPGEIGMVVLREFSRVATDELRKPLIEMVEAGVKGLVIDLRNNSGGLLDEAVNVAGLFLPKGSLVVSTESRIEDSHRFFTHDEPIVPAGLPIVVLINRFTASAAEIVSGAMQDHERAVLVGQRSYGKGSVQNLLQIVGLKDDQYRDENHNNRFDNWETITKDWNQNGEFDFAPRIKLTIARYRLPSGRSIHRELDKEGSVTSEGGVEPDLEVDARRLEAWRVDEMLKLRSSRVPRDYVERHWSEHKDLFFRLADNDRKDTSLYPGFDELYSSLDTPLSPDDVRQMLRFEIRRRVQDARGQEFPQGDFVEDEQLKEAIRKLLDLRGERPENYEDYLSTIPSTAPGRSILAAADPVELREALEKIQQARRGDGRLSEETLARLAEILRSNLDK
jgi:C-terminal peptidase prc